MYSLALILCLVLTSAASAADGWVSLFDGKTTAGWRGYNSKTVTTNWTVVEGCLHNSPKPKTQRDLISVETYDQFELEWDWKIKAGVNSGVKYFVEENHKGAIGHEYQMLDDDSAEWKAKGTVHATGSFYDVLIPTGCPTKPIGEFNHSRILVQGQKVEHWLNGVKVQEYTLGSPEVKAAIAKSKFKNEPGFADRKKAHILLQDHGGEVWFKNIRIRPLTGQD
jgi:Domain of Unknown Function (DUF1080)